MIRRLSYNVIKLILIHSLENFCKPEHGVPAHPLVQGFETSSRIWNISGHQIERVELSSDQPLNQVILI